MFWSTPSSQPVPTDRIRPLHLLENNVLVQGVNMAISLVFGEVLDAEILRGSLEGLLKREGWERLGGRLRKNASGAIEWHIPVEFTPARPALTFVHVDHAMSADAHAAGRRIPRPTSRPAVVGDPDDLAGLAWGPGHAPGGISDYVNVDRPVLGLRVNSFTDRTIVTLQCQHVAFDALGLQHVVEAWSAMLWGRSDAVPRPCGVETDPFAALGEGATETHLLADRQVGLWGLLKWGLGYGLDVLLRVKENRMVCIPETYWRPQLDRALEELRAEAVANGQDASKVFLTENDIITAWILRTVVRCMDIDPTRPVSGSIGMSLRKAFEGHLIPPAASHPYIGNAFDWANLLTTADNISSQPLSWLARQLRRTINEQGTRQQHEAYFALVRAGYGLPIAIFGSGDMVQVVFSNWSKANLFELDFAPARRELRDGVPCRPSYAQANHGPVQPVNGFCVLGKDASGNYWTSACKVKGQWEKFEKQLERDFETGE